jgi:hypothetical protein
VSDTKIRSARPVRPRPPLPAVRRES